MTHCTDRVISIPHLLLTRDSSVSSTADLVIMKLQDTAEAGKWRTNVAEGLQETETLQHTPGLQETLYLFIFQCMFNVFNVLIMILGIR